MHTCLISNVGPLRPVGVVKIICDTHEKTSDYDVLLQKLTKHGYVVSCSNRLFGANTDDALLHALTQEQHDLESMLNKYSVPIFLIGNGYGGLIAQQITMNQGKCTACICTDTKYSWWEKICIKTGMLVCGKSAKTLFTSYKNRTYGFHNAAMKIINALRDCNHPQVPTLILGGAQDAANITHRIGKSLYGVYGDNNLNNLTLIMYPDKPTHTLLGNDCTDTHQDILRFLYMTNKQI